MEYVVAKPFKTLNRRFNTIGQGVTRAEIEGSVTFDQFIERGNIAPAREPEAKAAPAKWPKNKGEDKD